MVDRLLFMLKLLRC